MPRINDYEEFTTYLLRTRKELKINLRWDIKKSMLHFKDTLIYFNSYIECMCFLEGYRKGLERC